MVVVKVQDQDDLWYISDADDKKAIGRVVKASEIEGLRKKGWLGKEDVTYVADVVATRSDNKVEVVPDTFRANQRKLRDKQMIEQAIAHPMTKALHGGIENWVDEEGDKWWSRE